MAAGFETVVRPVIFPNIRPTPARSLVPEDDPNKGICVIRGSSAKQVSLSNSTSISTSKSRPSESKRRVDTARVYQQDDDGNVDKDTFVDVDVTNKMWMDGPAGGGTGGGAAPSGLSISTLADDFLTGGSSNQKITTTYFYARIKEEDNIEILEKDVIKKNESR